MQRIASTKQRDISEDDIQSAVELDSHADSPVAGRSATIVHRTGRQVNVSGFTDQLGKPISVEIVHALVIYECPYTGEIYKLQLCNALDIQSIDCCLIHPIMMRLAGVMVDECPKFLSSKPSVENHSIYFPEENLRIPLMLDGIISCIPSRKPTNDEVNDESITTLDITPKVNVWDPHNPEYQQQEEMMLDYKGHIKDYKSRNFIISSVTTIMSEPALVVEKLDEMFNVSALKTIDGSYSKLDANQLAERLGITLEVARRTIKHTTHLCPRNTTTITLNRRYPQNDRMLRYRHLDVNMFSDTMYAAKRHGKSVRNNTCVQVFTTDFGWIQTYCFQYERDIHKGFKTLFKDTGVPRKLIMDEARSQVKGETRKVCEQAGCTVIELEKETPASNRAERVIQELKMGVRQDLKRSGCPLVFWCYCLERRTLINNYTSRNNFELKGMTPHSYLTGEMTDISNLCNFGWYEWIKYRKIGESFPISSEKLGRCLGPAQNKGNEMSQYVLTESGEVLPIQTLRSLSSSELENEHEGILRKEFDLRIRNKFGDHRGPPSNWIQRRRKDDDDNQYEDPFWETKGFSRELEEFTYEDGVAESHEMPEADDIGDYDLYLNAQVSLPHGDKVQKGTVIGRLKDTRGNPIGHYNKNPILDSRVYEVMFPDGMIGQYSANIIAESIYNEVDEDGRTQQFMDEIIDLEETPDAVDEQNAFVISSNGSKKRRITTKGWNFHVKWKDGTASWVPLKDIKESYPIQTAEYAVMRGVNHKPAFVWWVPSVLKKKDTIISKVKSRLTQKTHKYGIEVPRNIHEALRLDEDSKTSFWRDAVKKEMRNVSVAFSFLEDDERLPIDAREIGVHLIFDVKMDLTRKARLVAGGHRTPDPIDTTYAGVVTRESVRIVLTYAALLELSVWGADILNAFVTAPTSENCYIVCGPEFGGDRIGKRAIIKRALYGIKSAARDFRNHLRECMQHLGFTSCLADTDLWYRQAKTDQGMDYYEYMLFYVNNCLIASQHPKEVLYKLSKYFPLKPGSV